MSTLQQIAVLGSTGSIGKQTLDVARRLPDRLRVTALAANANAALLAEQALQFGVSAVALYDETHRDILDDQLPRRTERFFGPDSLETLAIRPDVDIVVVAVAGAVGTRATIAALCAGKTVALATKEVLVAAGEIVTSAARLGGGRLLPIDSEHSGVFQCLQGQQRSALRRIWLTASGGPFRKWTSEQLQTVTPSDALKHPTWSMGNKITIDSATMMNKGLETIEARWLFDLPIEDVSVVVHPQSTVHALVEFCDGSLLAQMGLPDMRVPIEYALLYPDRADLGLPHLDPLTLGRLDFEPPDENRFPCLRLAREAAQIGGTMPAVLNAANEAAVDLFLRQEISFLGIPSSVEAAMQAHTVEPEPTLDHLLPARGCRSPPVRLREGTRMTILQVALSDVQVALTYMLVLGVLVIVHEWGHFIVARLCGIPVDEFSVGFGPRALRIGKRGDTEYNLRWIPLGGYVKIAGMEPDEEPLLRAKDRVLGTKSEPADAISKLPFVAENTPDMNETDEQRARDAKDGFYTKPLWQRSLVIFAGPFMSFFFGYLVLCSIGLLSGYPTGISNVIDSVQDGSIAQKIGLRADDKIIRIDSTVITTGEQMVGIIHKSIGKQLALTVDRGGKDVVLKGAPEAKTLDGETVGIFGFAPRPSGYHHAGFRESVADGNRIMLTLFSMLGKMVQHHRLKEFRQNTGGPIYIASVTAQAVKDGPGDVLLLAAQLSISLAMFNLLPIPILDGGHLLLFGIEGLRRGRRLTIEQQQNFMLAGLAIIGVLFVFIMFNDVWVRVLHHPVQ